VKRILMIGVLLLSSACESDDVHHPAADGGKTGHSGADSGTAEADGVCDLARCPKPATGIACCTPDARCGNATVHQRRLRGVGTVLTQRQVVLSRAALVAVSADHDLDLRVRGQVRGSFLCGSLALRASW